MDLTRWLIQMWRWARNPPPLWKVLLFVGVLAFGLALYGVEHTVGWPDWLTVNKPVRIPR